jgi:hypothetical protein
LIFSTFSLLIVFSPVQSAETTWLRYISPVPLMCGP